MAWLGRSTTDGWGVCFKPPDLATVQNTDGTRTSGPVRGSVGGGGQWPRNFAGVNRTGTLYDCAKLVAVIFSPFSIAPRYLDWYSGY